METQQRSRIEICIGIQASKGGYLYVVGGVRIRGKLLGIV